MQFQGFLCLFVIISPRIADNRRHHSFTQKVMTKVMTFFVKYPMSIVQYCKHRECGNKPVAFKCAKQICNYINRPLCKQFSLTSILKIGINFSFYIQIVPDDHTNELLRQIKLFIKNKNRELRDSLFLPFKRNIFLLYQHLIWII